MFSGSGLLNCLTVIEGTVGQVFRYSLISKWRESYRIETADKQFRIDILGNKDRSLKYQKIALESGFEHFPYIAKVIRHGTYTIKISEWILGDSLSVLFCRKDILTALGESVGKLHNVKIKRGFLHNDDITMHNIIWSDKPIMIDLDRLVIVKEPDILLVKAVLKRIVHEKQMRDFLSGYAKYHDISRLVKECEKRKWRWKR